MQLATLYVKMYEEMNVGVNPFQAVNTLVHAVNKQVGFLAVGVYEEGVLTGFIVGYEFSENVFYFASLYMTKKNSGNLKKLIDYSLAIVKDDLKYTSWVLDAHNENMALMAEKYGAELQSIRYKRVF